MKKFLNKLINQVKQNGSGKPSKKTGYIIVIGLIGLLLILLGNVFTSDEEKQPMPNMAVVQKEKPAEETFSDKKSNRSTNMDEIEASYEKELVDMLNKIKSVSEAEVMVNLESTRVKVYEKNLISGQQITKESDSNGGTRKIKDSSKETKVVLVQQGDKEVPLLVQTKKPEVRGVLIIAQGVDHAKVKKWVIDSVSSVLDVPAHRISVKPKN